MMITWERLKLPVALALVTSFIVHLLWYPIYGEHFARLGDQNAIRTIRQWHRWNPLFVLGLAAGWAIMFSIMRRHDDRSRIIAFVTSGTALLAIIVLELLLMAAYANIRYSLHRG
jgi:predicted lysophospholipase L1 biosynthesis ABC-type transport system permease subunit